MGHFLIILLPALLFNNLVAQGLYINEIMSSNSATIADEDGQYPDWLELYYNGPDPINLSGYALSDDPLNPSKWTFGDTGMYPGGYLLIFASGKDKQGSGPYWNSVVRRGDEWAYFLPDSQPPAEWISVDFDDSHWKRGPTGIGYGDGDDETVIPATMSVFSRRVFTIDDLNPVRGAVFHIDFDDAFVAYLNGQEIARANIGSPGVPPAFDQPANSAGHEANIYRGGFPDRFDIADALSLLHEGENVLAVQVHNAEIGSSDLSCIPFLTLQQDNPAGTLPPDPVLQLAVSNFHTNFKIKSDGEFLLLSDSNGLLVDSLFTGPIPTDISLGRQPDGSDHWVFFSQPTPFSPNTTTGSDTIVQSNLLKFSKEGGFYDTPIQLILRTDGKESTIYYTRDGSPPDANSDVYLRPLRIDTTMVIRAVAQNTSGVRSPIVTHTYFINEKRPLSVVSIATRPEDFDLIYENHDVEKPVNIEMYEQSGRPAFNSPAGAEVFGSGSADFEQKSLSIFFRSRYGNGTLKYKLFPDLPFIRYESFVLRNSGNDWWSTLLRDALVTNGLMQGTAIDYQEYRPVVVYINGQYWGIHNIREKVNEHFIRDHHFIDPANLDMLEYKEVPTPEIIHGDRENYNALLSFLEEHPLSDQQSYHQVTAMIDVDNFMDYQIAEIYCANIDWPANNNKFWRSRDGSGRWRWILYDTDTGFGLWDEWWADGTPGWELDHVAHAMNSNPSGSTEEGWPNPSWSTYIFRRLLGSREFREAFINRFADYLNTRLSPQNVMDKISQFEQRIAEALPDHLLRWERSPGDYSHEIGKVRTFALKRADFVRQHLDGHFRLGGTCEVTLKINPGGGGTIRLNSLIITEEQWQGTYFSDLPIQLTAEPAPGYVFKEWAGIGSSDSTVAVTPGPGLTITARFERDSLSDKGIVINEINYRSHSDFDPGDWVELFNNSFREFDLGSWKIKDSADSDGFEFPEGTFLRPGGYLVLCRDSAAFSGQFPTAGHFERELSFGLSAAGDVVRLFDAQGRLVDSVGFSAEPPWPFQPNGHGPTLELKNPNLDNSLAKNWTASRILGTPGSRNSAYEIRGKLTPEVRAVPDYDKIQTFPNPSTGITTFRFNLERDSLVKLLVFDLLGRKVATIIDNRFFDRGQSEVKWDNRNRGGYPIASGIYFYMFRVNHEIVKMGKMVKL